MEKHRLPRHQTLPAVCQALTVVRFILLLEGLSGPYPVSEILRETLRVFPDETVQACAEFQVTGDLATFDRAVLELIHHHLSPKPPKPLSTYPGTTTLVAELGLDSITLVEMVFVFEDLFQAKLPQEELLNIVTIDDLRGLVRKHLPATKTE